MIIVPFPAKGQTEMMLTPFGEHKQLLTHGRNMKERCEKVHQIVYAFGTLMRNSACRCFTLKKFQIDLGIL